MTIYYAAINTHATTTSVGFSNTWDVIGFSTKESRDAFVNSRDDLATRAIAKREVTRYASHWHMALNEYVKPAPFSGEYWGLDDSVWGFSDNCPDGYAGHVMVCDRYDTAPRVFA